MFKVCDDISSASEIDTLMEIISDGLGTMAMVNYPYATDFTQPLPPNPVNFAC